MRKNYIDIPEGRLHYLRSGKGVPLMLIPQNPRSSRMYEELIPLLQDKFDVIAPDMPGTGGSSPAIPAFRIEDLALATLHFLDALRVERCHIFGIHTGGIIGAEVAGEWPARVDRLICYGYAAPEGQERQATAQEYIARASSLVEQSSDGTHVTRQWLSGYRQITHMWWHTGTLPVRDLPPPLLRFQQRYLLDVGQGKESAAAMYRAVFNYDWRSRLPRVQAKTLFVDLTSPYEPDFCRRGNVLKSLIKDGSAVTLDKADANTAEFAPAKISALILEFLAAGR